MRIIAGKYKRRLLATLPGNEVTRPTSDRVKESIFNIIAAELEDACVLDLFAGSGALGLEALSRGAKHVVFVEQNQESCKIIQNNLNSLDVPRECYKIMRSDVSQFLASRKWKENTGYPGQAALILADPPYKSQWYSTALEEITASELYAPRCLVVLEMDVKLKLNDTYEHWTRTIEREYGNTRIEIFARI